MLKYILLWAPMVLLAILNGALRQFTYGRHMAELRANQLSRFTGCAILGAYMWRVFRVWPADSARHAAAIGALWVALTVAFEFLFFHYLAKRPWEQLLHEYDLPAGRLWVLVLLWVGIAPYLFFRAGLR
ncbi:MAG: hypothetical protein ACE15B_02720 [Bryobacteraceae bacterium]